MQNTTTNYSRSGSADSLNFYFIPFVRDSQNFVNACLVIKTGARDTSFKWMCDWQYKDTVYTGISRRATASILMMLDKEVFGTSRKHLVSDTTVFDSRTSAVSISGTSITGGAVSNRLGEIQICASYWAPVNGWLTGCAPGSGCNPYQLVTICISVALDDDNSTDNINNGSGWGSTNPNPGGGSTAGWTQPPANPCALLGSGGREPELPPGCTEEYGPEWVPMPIEDESTNPCVVAHNAAKRMDSTFTISNADSVIATISNLDTGRLERGFPIFKRFRVNPQNVHDTTLTGSYFSGSVQSGTDSSIIVNSTPPYLCLLATWLHTHPPSGYTAHSAKDVYELIGSQMQYGHWFEGTLVAAYDGSQYALTVTNDSSAFAFYSTISQNLNEENWNETSAIGKAFTKAYNYFSEKVFNTNSNKKNLAYEMAMALVLNQFNAGVTLHKKDVNGNFKPLVVTAHPDPKKPKRVIYTQECT